MKPLAQYRFGADRFIELVQAIPSPLLSIVPDRQDAWSIRDHVIHVVDTEINAFVRLKSIVAQPGSECYVMDEDTWTRNIQRKDEDVGKYLNVFRILRELAHDFISGEPENRWNDHYFVRTYGNETTHVTLAKWLEIYNNHLDFHMHTIEEARDLLLGLHR